MYTLKHAASAYLVLYFFNVLSLKFQNIKFLSHLSVTPTKLKLDTHMGTGLICCVNQIQAARKYLFIVLLFFLALQLGKIKNLHLQNCFNMTLLAWPGVCELCSLSAIFFLLLLLVDFGCCGNLRVAIDL